MKSLFAGVLSTVAVAVLACGLVIGVVSVACYARCSAASPTACEHKAAGEKGLCPCCAGEVAIPIAAGALACAIVSVASVALYTHRPANEAGRLKDGLIELSRGKREVEFPRIGLRELDDICDSACVLQDRLLHEEELRRQWMHDITHDLRTPAAGMKAQLEAVRDGALELTRERIDLIIGESDRLERLIEDLLCLQRVESPGSVLVKREISIQSFVGRIENRFTPIAREKGRSIAAVVSVSSRPFFADERLIDRALSNLVQNAIQHSPTGSSITVSVFCSGNDTVFEVTNPGYIPEAALEKIFDRLFRLDPSRNDSGCGLGLSIARAIAIAHGGDLSARNLSGDSVRFSLRIPA